MIDQKTEMKPLIGQSHSNAELGEFLNFRNIAGD